MVAGRNSMAASSCSAVRTKRWSVGACVGKGRRSVIFRRLGGGAMDLDVPESGLARFATLDGIAAQLIEQRMRANGNPVDFQIDFR